MIHHRHPLHGEKTTARTRPPQKEAFLGLFAQSKAHRVHSNHVFPQPARRSHFPNQTPTGCGGPTTERIS